MPVLYKRIFKLSCILLAAILATAMLFGVVAVVLVMHFNAPPQPAYPLDLDAGAGTQALRLDETDALIIEVRQGESAQSVGRRLENAKVIKSSSFWNVLARLSKEHIKAGTYRIELPASTTKIRSVLVAGETLLVRVTLPEGITLARIGAILEDAGICPLQDFLAAARAPEILAAYNVPGGTMEGYLFPDTYLFPLSYPAGRVVAAMADNFYRRLAVIAPATLTMTPAEINSRLVMASIVEREYRAPDEAALMAGVFFNRLDIGMPLQSCATVVYVITEVLGRPHPERLFFRDLEIVNPYNTYLLRGLPPGPISAPGETALLAAFNPQETNYLYFRLVNEAQGRHYFSRTYDDHIRAGALFVKGR